MEFAGEANEAINGDNSTLPTELTEFVSKISSSLYLALAAGKLLNIGFGVRNSGAVHFVQEY